MDSSTILLIVSAVLTAAGAFFGVKSELVKRKLKEARNLMKEAVDVLSVASDAVADNKIDSVEAEAIKKEVQEMIGAFKVLVGKAE